MGEAIITRSDGRPITRDEIEARIFENVQRWVKREDDEDEDEYLGWLYSVTDDLASAVLMIGSDDCVDCHVSTFEIREGYMVTDEIWESTGIGGDDGHLCIGCLETRIGRALTAADFINAPINGDRFGAKSDRLTERLQGWVFDEAEHERWMELSRLGTSDE